MTLIWTLIYIKNSVTADDEEMARIITSKVDLSVAELMGTCQTRWGNDQSKRELTNLLQDLNENKTFVP